MNQARRHRLVWLLLLVAMTLLAACGGAASPTAKPAEAAKPTEAAKPAAEATKPAAEATKPAVASGAKKRLSIATGGTGGVYYPYGGGLAKLISDKVPNTDVTAEVTSASVDNLKFIGNGQADIAFTLADTAYDAVQGRDKFTTKVQVRALAVLYANYTHIIAADGSGIAKLSDLKGKRVSVGSPNSGTEVIADRMLEAAGLDPNKDITRERLGAAESAGALKDRKLDAFFWSGGLPTGAITDLAATPGFKMKLIPNDDVIEPLKAKYGPLYFKISIPKSSYPGMDADVAVTGVANILVVNDTMDPDLVYAITKAMHENKAQLDPVHPEAKKLTPQSAVEGSSVPFHPGAIKYYQEKGVWKP